MKKLVHSLGLMVALATVAGCELYFGGHNDGGTWNYCGSDGYYNCQGDNCEWVSPTCPSGGGGGSDSCSTSADCAAGCYCASGTCEEAGFCATDADCGEGYVCNEERSSCEPEPPGCKVDPDCPSGTWCDPQSGECTIGTCVGPVDGGCGTEPNCPAGQSPLYVQGCYTGTCFETALCSPAPSCGNVNTEAGCLARNADCTTVYAGINCTTMNGTACQAGQPGCTCQSYEFYKCRDK